jgi:hypothetical protein
VRAASPTALFVLYSVAMIAWLVFIGQAARLAPDLFERFVRLSGWPTQITIIGLVWTILLVAAVLGASRAGRRLRTAAFGTITVVTLGVTFFIPTWFRDFGYIGISTSEFLDAMFLLLGGALPGGQATVGLLCVCAVLVGLTFASAIAATARLDRG